MKKIIMATALVMGVCISGTAMALTPAGFTVTTTVTPGTTGAATECPLLADPVTLSVSSNVVGAWQCDETANVINVAACHSGGSRSTGVACSTDADPSTTAWDAPGGCNTNTGNSSIPSFKAFAASSKGGVMGEYDMDQRCTTNQLEGITFWL